MQKSHKEKMKKMYHEKVAHLRFNKFKKILDKKQ